MPLVHAANLLHYYRLEGSESKPVMILSHCLGQDHGLWQQQSLDLMPYFRVLRYDIRGHGATDAPWGEYTIEQLGGDVLAIADALGIGTFAFCGLSIGGMIGQWLGSHAPERLTRLVLANTSAKLPVTTHMEERRKTVLDKGMGSVSEVVVQRFFSAPFYEANGPSVGSARAVLLATNEVGYAGGCAAIRDHDETARLGRIKVPTLVISGDHDIGMPWEGHSDVLACGIPDAKVVKLNAGHVSNLELPEEFSKAVIEFAVS